MVLENFPFSPYCCQHARLSRNLYKYLLDHAGCGRNVLISPFCAEITLLALYTGADDRKNADIEKLLGVDAMAMAERISTELRQLKLDEDKNCQPNNPEGKDENFRLYLACAVLLPPNAPAHQPYADKFSKILNPEILPMIFSENIDRLTEFIQQLTLESVRDVVFPATPPGNAVAVNALHFRSNWHRPFGLHRTFKMEFTAADGFRREVDTLHGKLKCPCWIPDDMGGAKFLEVPFEDDWWKAIFVLPGKKRCPCFGKRFRTLSELTDLLTPEKLTTISQQLRYHTVQEVTVQIPKFRIAKQVQLETVLSELGVRMPLNELSKPLRVTSFLQKISFSLDERGVGDALPIKPERKILENMDYFPPYKAEFIANRPFAFFVRHYLNGQILYIGHVTDPAVLM